jgi:Nucleotidyltransferase domain/Aminoglycoside adenylyltransferase, C-terminal domain
MLLDRLAAACTSVLPDATVIVTGSLALGDYQPGKSDVDLLVLSDAPTVGLVEAVEQAWSQEPGEFDLRVVRYKVAARPRCRPHLALGISDYGDRFEVQRDTEEADLVVEFSVCRQLGRSDVIGPVPDEWVDEVGAAVLTRWKTIGDDAPDRELMALTACRIWRFREERVHCSKRAAAQWARERGADVAYDDAAVRTLLDRASG